MIGDADKKIPDPRLNRLAKTNFNLRMEEALENLAIKIQVGNALHLGDKKKRTNKFYLSYFSSKTILMMMNHKII